MSPWMIVSSDYWCGVLQYSHHIPLDLRSDICSNLTWIRQYAGPSVDRWATIYWNSLLLIQQALKILFSKYLWRMWWKLCWCPWFYSVTWFPIHFISFKFWLRMEYTSPYKSLYWGKFLFFRHFVRFLSTKITHFIIFMKNDTKTLLMILLSRDRTRLMF